ncbi:MAG: hypothetical protein EKK42_08660 [Pseudonocardiaceae bacterium]|nr:MAG: hypothetical protein EKK42_08660 [Pseudonocardiaceae bacterium]
MPPRRGAAASPPQPNPPQPSPPQPNPAQPNPAQPNPARPNPAQPNPAQPNPPQPNPPQPSSDAAGVPSATSLLSRGCSRAVWLRAGGLVARPRKHTPAEFDIGLL